MRRRPSSVPCWRCRRRGVEGPAGRRRWRGGWSSAPACSVKPAKNRVAAGRRDAVVAGQEGRGCRGAGGGWAGARARVVRGAGAGAPRADVVLGGEADGRQEAKGAPRRSTPAKREARARSTRWAGQGGCGWRRRARIRAWGGLWAAAGAVRRVHLPSAAPRQLDAVDAGRSLQRAGPAAVPPRGWIPDPWRLLRRQGGLADG